MQTYLYSSKGPRPSNQDSASLAYISGGVLICIADGVGGNKGGEIASKLAIEIFLKEIICSGLNLHHALNSAHNEIIDSASKNIDLSGMATTFTAMFVANGKVKGIHCGDSRAYILRGNGIKQLTEDHSEVAKLTRSGKLTKEEAIEYPRKNVIYSALGSQKPLVIDSFEFDLLSKDRLILLTDGVHGIIPKKTFRDYSVNSTSMKEWCDSLIMSVDHQGPDDNFTIAAVELD